ncbi:dipeptidase [Rhodoferax aquaticus]|uniref:Peptidase M19 n=1 Tax=Rhodoferax aquaticus TaxID=2527691 RepID=A0A515EKN2_9BURK|nr:dipeptidase [Rhodoferax aquaticus]QDL53227.1 peptidase M19 [Rhodoferax aquaticus]
MRRLRRVGLAVAAVLAAGLAVFFYVPTLVDGKMNQVVAPGPYAASAKATALYSTLFVADLHDDALLWNRDLLTRYSRGHSDLPRQLDARLGLQVFAAVTKTPKGMNYERNSDQTDNITMLIMAQRWPVATWNSLLERALYQSEKLHTAAADSHGQLVIVKSQKDLAAHVQAWQKNPQRVAAVLALEGLHPLQGELAHVDRLFDAGYRIAGLTHFFDNEVGGSAHGMQKGGLTPFGREVVARLQAKHMLIDVAHASKPVMDDVLALAKAPVLVSHTGVAGTCPGPRNLTDAHLRGIAATGGLVGIGYWDGAVCEPTVANIVKAMRYAIGVVGVNHVALGSDFNGATRTPFDVTGLAQIVDGLQQAGLSEADIRAVMGGNVQRVLLQSLPLGE